jgi:hypothetical protein
MKLLTTLVVAAFGQDYDFYSSGEAYRFGSVGDFSHLGDTVTAGGPNFHSGAANPQDDGFAPPIDSSNDSTDNSQLNSQGFHLGSSGIYRDSLRYLAYGHAGNRRYCHTTRHNRAVYNWTSHQYGGYFAEGRNIMECMGEELYCFIEERAHYGQIIGITAGCEQMMNHPSVTIQDQQALITDTYTQINAIKNNYNQEAARGGANRHGFFTYYGLGGCLAMPAQNGAHYTYDRLRPPPRGVGDGERDLLWPALHRVGVDSDAWQSYKWMNYYRNYHGGYGQNQCLRFPKQRLDDTIATDTPTSPLDPATVTPCKTSALTGAEAEGTDCAKRIADTFNYTSPGSLLPFGVSVCRACCVAQFSFTGKFTSTNGVVDDTGIDENYFTRATDLLCNYPPDADATIKSMTDDQFEELIPRFDMAGAAYNAFQVPNEPNKVMKDDRDNNLFVHGSWCDEPGPARGCARIPFEIANTANYIYGTDLSSVLTTLPWDNTDVKLQNWLYTCEQSVRTGVSQGGLQPINSAANRDWCPGRPWRAKEWNDSSQAKPQGGVSPTNVNIVG